jgi:hypothetical protein
LTVVVDASGRRENGKEGPVRAIFLSYRRDDAEGEAGRLFDDLIAEFSTDKVFMDVTGIEPGRDFRKVIDQNVASCGVLLAMMGKDWIEAKDDAGRRRLDDPLDFVRLETASALRRDIPVIPVLVHGGRMPRPDQLPEDLKDLAYRNAVELTHARWDSDVQLLIRALRPHVDTEPEEVSGASAKPALDQSIGRDITLDAKVAEVGRTTPATPIQATKRFWRGIVVAGVAAIVIAAGGAGLHEYKETEEAKVKKAATEAATRQATEDQKLAAEKEAARKAAEEKAAAEQATARKAAGERAAAEQAARKAAEEKVAAEQAARKAAEEKAAAEQAARKAAEEKAAAEKVAAEKAAAEKAAAERAAAEKAAAIKASQEKAAEERAAAERAAAIKASQEKAAERSGFPRNRLLGKWRNRGYPNDFGLPGISRVEIYQVQNGNIWVHVWGACSHDLKDASGDCDWGSYTAQLNDNMLNVTWSDRRMTITLGLRGEYLNVSSRAYRDNYAPLLSNRPFVRGS